MNRINLRRLLLFVVGGCFTVVVLVGVPAESQDRPKKIAPPLAPPKPRTNVIVSPERSGIFYATQNQIWVEVGFGTRRLLDWCRELGSNCGKPAADAFCHSKGYRTATKFEAWPNIGHTATFTDHQLCDSPVCGGFMTIECVGQATIFESPRISGGWAGLEVRLDWCRDWSANCGKPAADAYCQNNGLSRGALRFEMAHHLGEHTVTINGLKVCDNTKQNCDGFKVIECQR